jgi:Spy/CpxP family protein refolding chaperone
MRAVAQVATATSLVAVLAAAAQAQEPVTKDQPAAGQRGGGRGGQRMMQMLMDSLNLTADQRTKIDSINTAFQARMPAFTPGTPPSDEDRQKRMQLTQERTAAIKAVLTPDQAKKYDDMMAAMRSRMGGGRPPATR